MSIYDAPLSHIHGHLIGIHGGGTVSSSAITSKAEIAVTGRKDGAIMWNLKSKRQIRILSKGLVPVSDCSMSANGDRVITACKESKFRLWNGLDGKCMKQLESICEKTKTCWMSNLGGSFICVFADNNASNTVIALYDCFNDCCLRFRYKITKDRQIEQLRASPDQNYIVFTSQSELFVYDISQQRDMNELYFRSSSDTYLHFALSLQNFGILVACDKLFLRLYEKYRARDIHFPDYDPPAKRSLWDISADGKIVTAACKVGSFGVWFVSSRSRVFVLASIESDPRTCSISSNGERLIVGYNNGQVHLFDMDEYADESMSALKCENAEVGDDELQAESRSNAKNFLLEITPFLDNIKRLVENSISSDEELSEGIRKELKSIGKKVNSAGRNIPSHAVQK